ncbi:MAG: hypothetical protein ACFFD4_32445 [Candidatus Odinarchaeota archaeon]
MYNRDFFDYSGFLGQVVNHWIHGGWHTYNDMVAQDDLRVSIDYFDILVLVFNAAEAKNAVPALDHFYKNMHLLDARIDARLRTINHEIDSQLLEDPLIGQEEFLELEEDLHSILVDLSARLTRNFDQPLARLLEAHGNRINFLLAHLRFFFTKIISVHPRDKQKLFSILAAIAKVSRNAGSKDFARSLLERFATLEEDEDVLLLSSLEDFHPYSLYPVEIIKIITACWVRYPREMYRQMTRETDFDKFFRYFFSLLHLYTSFEGRLFLGKGYAMQALERDARNLPPDMDVEGEVMITTANELASTVDSGQIEKAMKTFDEILFDVTGRIYTILSGSLEEVLKAHNGNLAFLLITLQGFLMYKGGITSSEKDNVLSVLNSVSRNGLAEELAEPLDCLIAEIKELKPLETGRPRDTSTLTHPFKVLNDQLLSGLPVRTVPDQHIRCGMKICGMDNVLTVAVMGPPSEDDPINELDSFVITWNTVKKIEQRKKGMGKLTATNERLLGHTAAELVKRLFQYLRSWYNRGITTIYFTMERKPVLDYGPFNHQASTLYDDSTKMVLGKRVLAAIEREAGKYGDQIQIDRVDGSGDDYRYCAHCGEPLEVPVDLELTNIVDLREGMEGFNISFQVVEDLGTRKIRGKRKGKHGPRTHSIRDVLVTDHSGSVVLSLWNRDTGELQVGDHAILWNGAVKLVRDELRLSRGKGGKFQKLNHSHGH